MTEAVIDELEVVQIDEQDSGAPVPSGGPSEGQVQVLQEPRSVPQTRQRVVERRIGELFHCFHLDPLAVGYVGNHTVDKKTAIF